MTKVLYPGSFDPITKGHMNIIEQASDLFDEIIVAVLINPKKTGMFTLEERIEMIQEIYKNFKNIKIESGVNAAVDVAFINNCKAIIRGIRTITDFDYEIQLAQINKQISDNQINTICLLADLNYQFISSSMVKELFGLGKDISNYVDPIVKEKMIIKKREMNYGK